MASGLSGRVRSIENAISLLGMLYDRLRLLQPPMSQLIRGMAAMEQFADTEWLQCCRDKMRRGSPFPDAWRIGMERARAELADVLLPLGEVLGSTELEGQLSAIRHAQSLLDNRLADARAYRERNGKLYQSLGVMSGVAIAIILI